MSPRHAAVLEGIAWEARDGKGLHESGHIGHGENQHALEQGSARSCSEGGSDLAQRHIAQGVIEGKIEMGGQYHGERYSIDIPARTMSCLFQRSCATLEKDNSKYRKARKYQLFIVYDALSTL
jgi:hypothetical protein